MLNEEELKLATEVAEEVIDVKDYKELIDIEYWSRQMGESGLRLGTSTTSSFSESDKYAWPVFWLSYR